MPTLMTAVVLLLGLLSVDPVKGRKCYKEDIFNKVNVKNGDVSTTAIPKDCSSLDLWDNEMGNLGATTVVGMLRASAALAELHMYGTSIGDKYATVIAEALKGNSTLKVLDLDGTNIGDKGATTVAEALKVNNALRELHLDGNSIMQSGVAAIGEALKVKYCTDNAGPWLFNNMIGSSGATVIAEALKYNCALTELCLSGNNIADDGATAIGEALKVAVLGQQQHSHSGCNRNYTGAESQHCTYIPISRV